MTHWWRRVLQLEWLLTMMIVAPPVGMRMKSTIPCVLQRLLTLLKIVPNMIYMCPLGYARKRPRIASWWLLQLFDISCSLFCWYMWLWLYLHQLFLLKPKCLILPTKSFCKNEELCKTQKPYIAKRVSLVIMWFTVQQVAYVNRTFKWFKNAYFYLWCGLLR